MPATMMRRGPMLALVLVSLLACQAGEGKADSLAIAQIGATSTAALVLPLKESAAALGGLRRVDLRTSFQDFPGVDTAALRTRVESRARRAGLIIDSTAPTTLLLRCFSLTARTGMIGYTCSTDLSDVVTYGNPPKAQYQAILWGAAPIIGMAGQDHLSRGVTEIVDEEVETFLRVWSTMNPR